MTDPLSPPLLAAAFAGGAFGAAVGALQSFSLAGLVVVLGELHRVAHRSLGAGPLPVDLTNQVAFGVVLGPHVAFGGGAAALAYVVRRDDPDTGFPDHEAKQVTRGLGTRPDVLAVGGAFGVLGHLVATLSAGAGLPVDPVALGVVGSALAHRLAFGYSVFGAPLRDLLDVSGTAEPWLPYQHRFRDVAGLGAVVGLLGAYLAYLTASPFLAFGLSVVALVFLCAGVEGIPVTHHVSLPASTAVLALVDAPGPLTPAAVAGSVDLGVALAVGAAFGVVGALVGELLERALYAHAETHLDPPAASIVVTSALVGLLALAGVFPSSAWVPTP